MFVNTLNCQRVVLMVDVMTAGVSLFTAAWVLKAAGVSELMGLVVAQTE